MHCVQSANWHGRRQSKRAWSGEGGVRGEATGKRREGKGRGEEQVLLLMLRQIGLATLQWNCTEIFLIISEQQRSSGCLATQAGKAHFVPHSPPSPPCPSLFQLLSQLCVYIKSMKCNNVMSNCAKVIKDTMRSYAKKQHAIWPGITRDNSGENTGKTQGKLLVAAAIMAAVTDRGSGSG